MTSTRVALPPLRSAYGSAPERQRDPRSAMKRKPQNPTAGGATSNVHAGATANVHAQADDVRGFEMTLLHYRRTFVEKMFAIHGKVQRLLDEEHPLGRDARHYPDLFALAGTEAVRNMLASEEYEEIRLDYDRTSRKFFESIYRPPERLSFRDSPALFPDQVLRARLEPDYDDQCRLLFSDGNYPTFTEVLVRFAELRELL